MTSGEKLLADLKKDFDKQAKQVMMYRESQNAQLALLSSVSELLEQLEEFVCQYGCDCKHPACKNCERTSEAKAVIEKVKTKLSL